MGSNSIDYFIYNTVNASLGPDSPTEFDPGMNAQNDTNFNFDLSYAAADTIHVAAGAEWRNEEFVIGGGEPDSWRFGPGAAQGFSAASNGFPGFSPIAVGSWDRSNYAVYGDVEAGGPDQRYTLAAALRAEWFTDFGSTVNYKFAGRAEAGRGVAFRGSASSGFRAPTPGQQNAFNVTSLFDPLVGDIINSGTIPSTSAVAALVGGRALRPERSRNYTGGALFSHGSFSLTADYFRIDLSDRLWFSRSHTLSPEQVDSLVAEGVTSASNLGVFRFFTNQIGTASQGIDIVSTYAPALLDGDTVFSFLLNHTKTDVTAWSPETVDDSRINLMENAYPETRWNLSVRHEAGRLQLLVRLSYWGDFFDREDGINYPGDYLTDVELTFRLTESVSWSIGGQNLFNNYPEQNPFAFVRLGNKYPQTTPYGFNGGYYYTRLTYQWDRSF